MSNPLASASSFTFKHGSAEASSLNVKLTEVCLSLSVSVQRTAPHGGGAEKRSEHGGAAGSGGAERGGGAMG